MSERAKSKAQLKQDILSKITGLKILLDTTLKMEKESIERIELSATVASNLRAILCGDRNNSYLSLVERTDYHKHLLFPLYDPMACLNILPTYNLLRFSIKGDEGVNATINDDVFKNDRGHWNIYLNYKSWLNEIVIDTKLKSIEPLTRYDVVKIVADSTGAHVDNEIEKHLFEMSKQDLLPIIIRNGVEVERNLEIKAKTVLSETILAIAQELIISFDRYKNSSTSIVGPSNQEIRLQKYLFQSSSKEEPVKYSTAQMNEPVVSHTYNSNSYFECEVYEKIGSVFSIKHNGNAYLSIIVDQHDVLSNGDYVENSIYPQGSTSE